METRTSIFARTASRVRVFLFRVWQAVRPGPEAVRGAAGAVLVAGILVYLAFVITSAAAGPWQFSIPGALLLAAAGALLLFLGQGIAWLVGMLAKIPWGLRWTLVGVFAMMNIALMGMNETMTAAVPIMLMVLAALVGAGLRSLGRRGPDLTRLQRVISVAGVLVGAAGLLAGLGWYLAWRGAPLAEAVNAAAQSGAALVQVSLPDPSEPGPYAVKTLTYGSGSDPYRPEFRKEAGLLTRPVDGSELLDSSWKGFTGQLRSLAWGFGPDALPLNGRVWYPEGQGPFPLVLMVHGNHNMMEFSDPGYAYLGELLASRGYIFVSVDENFINGGMTDLLDGMSGENDARGWLLLEHLRAWQEWNKTEGNPFYQLVDTDRIAVGGHSRGGEAAAIAAAFNRLPVYPDDASQRFDYNYNIRAVVAIAPIDGQYHPAWKDTPLSGVDYFVIQGSHDSDLTSFSGIDQYNRVDLGESGFKAALYVYRANHGQFNTVWGDADRGGLVAGFLNRGALLPAEDQRQIGKVYISAFLDASLKDKRGYLPLFQDARSAADGWLPDTIFINRFDQGGDLIVAGYEEDINLQTASLAGSSIRAESLDLWREQRVHSKWRRRDGSAVYLGWNEDQTAFYTIQLPEENLDLDAGSALIFNLADALQDPGHAPGHKPEEGQETGPRQPLDLSVVLVDRAGQTAQIALSDYHPVQPQLEASLYKAKPFEPGQASEPVLQSYAIPLDDFQRASASFNPAQIELIRFVFDRSERGSLVLDDVGFRP